MTLSLNPRLRIFWTEFFLKLCDYLTEDVLVFGSNIVVMNQ